MKEELLNSNNLLEKIKELGNSKKATPNIENWLQSVAYKHWLKVLPQEISNERIDEEWFKIKSKNTIFKKLILTPQFTSEIGNLIDFLNENYKILKQDETIYKPLNKLNYLECQTQEKKWLDKINKKTSLEEDWKNLKEIEKIDFEGSQYTLYELVSKQNILREGKIMNNCISSYANKTDEESKLTKIFSIRDKKNKSLVSLSAKIYPYEITELEKKEWLNNYSLIKSKDKKAPSLPAEKERVSGRADFDNYVKNLNEKIGPLLEINEIKEVNNNLLDDYFKLTQSMLNKIFTNSRYFRGVNNYVLDECEFVNLMHSNKILIESDERIEPYYKLVSIEELNNENCNKIHYIPQKSLKKLKERIIKKPNVVGLSLMLKTGTINVSNCSVERLAVDSKYNFVKLNQVKARLFFNNPNKNQFCSIDKCDNIPITISKLNNLIAKDSKELEFEILGQLLKTKEDTIEQNYITIIDSSIKEVHTPKSKDNVSYVGNNFLLIDRKYTTTSREPNYLFSKNLTNIFHVDTNKNEIKKGLISLNELDVYPYIQSRYLVSEIGLPAYDLKSYIKERISFSKLNITTDVTELEIASPDLYNLTVNLSCENKNLLLEAFQYPNSFKDTIVENLIKNNPQDYENDFMEYTQVNIPEKFHSFINTDLKNKILEINEEFKNNLDEVNYRDVVDSFVDKLTDTGSISAVTPDLIERLKLTKAVFLENLHSSRMNNSRTKLNNFFVKGIVDFMEGKNNIFFTDEARIFIKNILTSPVEPVKKSRIHSNLR